MPLNAACCVFSIRYYPEVLIRFRYNFNFFDFITK